MKRSTDTLKSIIKGIAIIAVVLVVMSLLCSCGYSDHEAGSFEESALLFDEHLFSYMDRQATSVVSPTGYLLMVDTSTCSVAAYIRNPYGGWTRAWTDVAPVGMDILCGEYSLEYRIDSFIRNDMEYDHTYWLGNIVFAHCDDYNVNMKPKAYREAIYISEDNAKWIFENCPIGTPVVIFDSGHLAEAY